MSVSPPTDGRAGLDIEALLKRIQESEHERKELAGIRNLARERAKKALGPRFKLAEFHDQVLIHGALPLDLLEQVIDGWIAEKQKS